MFLGFGSPLGRDQEVPRGTAVVSIEDGHAILRCASCDKLVDSLDRCGNCNEGLGLDFQYLVVAGDRHRGWRLTIPSNNHLAFIGTAYFDHDWLMKEPRWSCPLTRLPHKEQWHSLIQQGRRASGERKARLSSSVR